MFFVSEFTCTSAPYRFEMDTGGAQEADPHFLFSLDEYNRAYGTLLGDALELSTKAKSPVLRDVVTTVKGERVRTQRVTTRDGTTIDIEPVQIALPFAFSTSDVVRFDLGSLARACNEAAEVLTDAKLDQLLNVVGTIAEGLGQVGSAGGRPFGWPTLLLGMEQIEIDFSPDGEPLLPRIVAENDKRHFVEYPPLTDADRPAFDELIARKREQFNAGRGRR